MTGCPHLLHGTGSNGGNSLEIQFFALQPPHTARRSGFLLWDASDTAQTIAGIFRANKLRTLAGVRRLPGPGLRTTLHFLPEKC
jgi:hypothetical protein